MQNRYLKILVMCLVLFSLFAACAGVQPEVTVGPEAGVKTLAIKASSFKFDPNNIKAYVGDVIILKVENVSGSNHNFTVNDPAGKAVQSVDLPPGKTVEIRVTLSESGTYDFYCDKTFHSFFGMKGQIEALKR